MKIIRKELTTFYQIAINFCLIFFFIVLNGRCLLELVLLTLQGSISACYFPILYSCFDICIMMILQFGTLARMLQVDPPPKAVKVTMSKRIPLVGDELKAYEEEQERIKEEEALKATLSTEEELKASRGVDANIGEPMVIDATSPRVPSNGNGMFIYS